jgi:hypothetical protein
MSPTPGETTSSSRCSLGFPERIALKSTSVERRQETLENVTWVTVKYIDSEI